MHAGIDIPAVQMGNQIVPVRHARNIGMEGAARVRRDPGGPKPCQIGKRLIVLKNDFLPLGIGLLQPRQLNQPDGRIQIVHIELVPHFGHFVHPALLFRPCCKPVPRTLGDAHPAQPLEALCQLHVVGGQHTAIAGRQVLLRLETETSDRSQPTNHPAFVPGAAGMGGILHNRDVPGCGNFQYRVHIAGLAAVMHNHNCSRSFRNPFGHAIRIQVQRDGIDVAENGNGSVLQDRVVGGDKGHGSGNDLAALHSQYLKRQQQRR